MKNNLDACELISRKPMKINNLPAEQLEFTWQSEAGVMAQRQTFVVHGRKVLIFTGTMAVRFTREGVRLWEHFLESFKFHENMK